MQNQKFCLSLISGFLVLIGIITAIASYELFDPFLKNYLDITPGEVLFQEWSKPAPKMEMIIHFFNWTNPEQFFNTSEKPSVTEIGPFKFDVFVEKKNLTYNPSNDTITYDLRRWYKFNREGSAFDLKHNVTLINQLSTSAAYKAHDMNYFFRKGISITLSSYSSLAVTKTAGEFLFEGYEDSLLNLFRKLPLAGVKVPDKFAFLYQKNGSSDGVFNIGTGRYNKSLGMLYEWNGANSSDFYGESCKRFDGAAMDFYTDNMENNKVYIFNPDFCRKMPLDYVGKSKVYGIEGNRYEMDISFLDNGTLIPGNECYCSGQCIRSGAVSASMCKGKANSYVSLPHFLKADPFYASKINGMKPNHKTHQFQVTVEPTTGILLKMDANLQVNVYIEPIESISMFAKAPTLLFPIMRVHHKVKIPEMGAFSLGIILSIKGVIICVGIVLTIIGLLIYMLFVLELRRGNSIVHDDVLYTCPEEMNPLKQKHSNG